MTSDGIGPAGLPALSALASSNSQAGFQPVGRFASRKRGFGMVLNVEPREVYLHAECLSYSSGSKAYENT